MIDSYVSTVFSAPDARPLSSELHEIVHAWASSQHRLVVVAADFADSVEWVAAGSPTAAHWLAAAADVEPCTAREWIRIGKRLRSLPAIAAAFESGEISYSKVRTATRLATPENEVELVKIANDVPAGELGRALALWLLDNSTPEQVEHHHNEQRSLKWRTEADGMVTFTLRLQPLIAGLLIAALTTLVMRSKPRPRADQPWPTVAQQHADAFAQLLKSGVGKVATEVVLHVRGRGCELDDGTPIAGSIVERIAPTSFLRALIHNAEGNPVDASNRRRHPTTRQKRIVKERDRVCVDCGRADLLEYDHNPEFEASQHTVTSELELRCAPCHHARTATAPTRRSSLREAAHPR